MTFGNRQVEILAALEDAPRGDIHAADMSAQMTTSAATDRLYKAFMKHGPAEHVLRRNHLSEIADDGCQGGRAGLAGNGDGDGWKVGDSEVGGANPACNGCWLNFGTDRQNIPIPSGQPPLPKRLAVRSCMRAFGPTWQVQLGTVADDGTSS